VTRRLGLPSLLILACGAALAAASAAAPVPEHSDPEPGARGVALTTLRGSDVEEIPLTFLGTQRNALGPGYDLHLVMLEGDLADHVGVAAGMSGSPVYIDGELVGALAYRVGFMPREAVAGVTPIRDILSAARSAPPPQTGEEQALAVPIGTPVQLGGLVGPIREWLAPRLRERGFVPIAGGSDAGDVIAGELRAGAPVGVELVRGDLGIAATGTVTLVDGDRVYAFGHSFFGDGRVEMPMTSVEVIHTLADVAGSFKLSRMGPELGVITEDRLSAVVGRTGRRARMIPLDLVVSGASYGERRFHFEVARHATLAPLLSGVAVANSLTADLGHEREATMLVTGRVRIREAEDLPLDLAVAGEGVPDTGLSIAGEIQRTLGALWRNPFAPLEVEGIELQVSVAPEARLYRVEALQYDRGPLRPGEVLDLQCVLRKYRGETVTRRFRLPIPRDLAGEETLVLAVGPPDQVERALGRPLDRRLSSARDLDTMIRALGEQRSAHRLTAVLFRRAGGVVSRGAEYGALPPTAERLLASRGAAGAAQRTPVALLARREIELDGPLGGGLLVRLSIDPALGSDEEK
jgi:hypothetical protein